MYKHYRITKANYERLKKHGVTYAKKINSTKEPISTEVPMESLQLLWIVYQLRSMTYDADVAVYKDKVNNILYLRWYERGVKDVKKIQKKNDVC